MILVLTTVKGWWRVALLAPTLYLAAFVWENLLIEQPSVTRLILFGALLVALMNAAAAGTARDGDAWRSSDVSAGPDPRAAQGVDGRSAACTSSRSSTCTSTRARSSA